MAMEFLAKISKIPTSAAVLVVFLAWYFSATVTTLLVTGMYSRILALTLWVLVCVVVFMFVMFLIAWRIKRTDLVDMAWGLAFIVAAIASFVLSGYGLTVGPNVQTLVTVLVIIWGARLALAIFLRLRSHPEEDKRYIELRKNWKGNLAVNTFVRIYLLQAVLATVISLAVIHINLSSPAMLNQYAYSGLAIWIIGFLFEVIGDFQLKRFLADPHNGKLMTEGLWKYTRHPNYFGEATMWWGIFVIALGTPYGWVGIISAVLITYLLLFVSGVPITEKAFEGRLGWKEYKKRTSKFFPLPPNPES